MEKETAESMVGQVEEAILLARWRQCAQVGEWGIERAGASDAMCHLVGYARSREAKSLERMNQFIPAQSVYIQSADWFRKALNAPYSVCVLTQKAQYTEDWFWHLKVFLTFRPLFRNYETEKRLAPKITIT